MARSNLSRGHLSLFHFLSFGHALLRHMKNYDVLLERVSATLRPGGKLFVHIFVCLGLIGPRVFACRQEISVRTASSLDGAGTRAFPTTL